VFAEMMLNGGEYNGIRIVSDSTVKLFTTRAAGSRALGWAMADGQWGSGRFLSDDAYGHVGYTGTSLWIDPDRHMFVLMLTNRVYAPKARRPATVIADVRADLSDAAALAVTDNPDQIIAMPASFRADRAVNWNPRRRVHHTSRRSRHTVKRTVHKSTSKKASAHRSRTSSARHPSAAKKKG
jgi:CubicO group peptidase (beta-lactamase class C family)